MIHEDTEDVLGKLITSIKNVRDKTDEDLTMYEAFDMYYELMQTKQAGAKSKTQIEAEAEVETEVKATIGLFKRLFKIFSVFSRKKNG